MRMVLFVVAAIVLAPATVAFGQYWGGAYVNNKAATAGESWARGMSDVIRANGVNNLMNSRAAINVQEANSAYLDNRLKYTQTYFENRRLNREYRAAERGPLITEQQAEQLARARAPQRATANDVNPITGKLDWPLALTADEYADDRAELDRLFAERAKQGGAIGLNTFNEIRSTSENLLAALQDNIKNYPPQQYMEAKRFVERISNEASFPTS